jgi:hypothetical protein
MLIAIRITVEIDEDRLREAGAGTADEDVMAELATRREGRLSLQTRDAWPNRTRFSFSYLLAGSRGVGSLP